MFKNNILDGYLALIYFFNNEQQTLCMRCHNAYAYFKIIQNHIYQDLCLQCVHIKYGFGALNFDELLKSNRKFDCISLLQKYGVEMLSKHMLFKVGESIKGTSAEYRIDIDDRFIATYNKTCDLARCVIREFCLYCIRYQKDKVNRDIRRKICELIWEDKIKFLILLYSFSNLMRLIFSCILHNQSFHLCTCHQWSHSYFA